MPQARFHIVWLFIFNASLIIFTPFIRGPGNYLAFTLIFLSTNLLILSFAWQAIKNGAIEIVLSPLSVVSLVFLAVILFSFFFTINPPSTRYGFFTMASVIINSIFLSFVIPPSPPFNKGGVGGIWKGLCLVLTITVTTLSLFALYQYITGSGDWGGRAHAVFVTPNSFAGYLLLTMPILIGLYLVSERMKYIFFFLSLLAFAALLATGTGGRWILLAAAVAAALILFWIFTAENPPVSPFPKGGLDKIPPFPKGGKGEFVGKGLIFLAIGFLTVLLLFFAPVGKGNVSLSPKPAELSGSTADRLNIWKSTWAVIKEHPIRGVGFWSFHTIYSKYKNQTYKDVEHYFSHNDYLQLWAELGLVGVGVFFVLIFVYFREGFRCLKKISSQQKENPPISPFSKGGTNNPPFVKGGAGGFLYIMLLSTLIGSFLVLVHTISDFDLYIPAILFIFWGYIAYTASAASELGLCKTKVIDFNSFRIFTLLGKKKLYIITAGIAAFLSLWVSDPYLAGFYNSRGRAYLGKGEYEKAIKFFSKAVELDSIDDSYHFNLGLALAKSSSDNPPQSPFKKGGRKGDFKGGDGGLAMAEEEMKKAMRLSPYRSDIYFNMAIFYRSFYLKEKGAVAIDMLKKAREFDPVDITITYNLGMLYMEMGRYKDAIDEFKKYLEEKPDDSEARIGMSGAYRMNREYDNALKEMDWLLNKNSNNNYVHFLKANVLAEMGRYNEAYNEYEVALREKGREGDVWYAIGILSLKQNKPKEAEAAFRKAVDYRSLDRKGKKD